MSTREMARQLGGIVFAETSDESQLVVPYAIVSGTWIWIRRILKSEES